MLNFYKLNKQLVFIFLFVSSVLINSPKGWATDLLDEASKMTKKQNVDMALEKATSDNDPVKAIKNFFCSLQNWDNLIGNIDSKDDYAVGAIYYYFYKFVNNSPNEKVIAILQPDYDRDDTVETILDKLGAAANRGDVRAQSKLCRFLHMVDNPNPVSVKAGIEWGRKAFRNGKDNTVPILVELHKLQHSFFDENHMLTWAPYDPPLQVHCEAEKSEGKAVTSSDTIKDKIMQNLLPGKFQVIYTQRYSHLPEEFKKYLPVTKFGALFWVGVEFRSLAKDIVKAAKYFFRAYDFTLCEPPLNGEIHTYATYAPNLSQEALRDILSEQYKLLHTTKREAALNSLGKLFNDINKNDNYITGSFYYYLVKFLKNQKIQKRCLGDVFFTDDVRKEKNRADYVKEKTRDDDSLLWNYSFKKLKMAAFVDKNLRAYGKLAKLCLMDTNADHIRLQYGIECERMYLENYPKTPNHKTLNELYKRQMTLINVKPKHEKM